MPVSLLFKVKVIFQSSCQTLFFIVHWGLGIGSTDTEATSVYIQEGGLGIGKITVGLGIRTGVSVSVQRPQSNIKQ